MTQEINGKTKAFGLIGNPIGHTLSPIIHNLLANELNINLVYMPYQVPNGELDKAIIGAKALNIQGLNVTVPYKVEVMKTLYKITSFAKQIGAVNTIKYTPDGYIGYNTDSKGLQMSLDRHDIPLTNRHCVIIGAGGAAKAVAILCASQHAKKITIINRTLTNAENLSKNISKYYKIPIDIVSIDNIEELKEFDIAFQTTPIGMSPKIDGNPVESSNFYKKFHIAVDLIYNPEKTKFLLKAEEEGINVLNGFEMLYYQAVRAFEIWNDISIDDSVLDKVFLAVQEYKNNNMINREK